MGQEEDLGEFAGLPFSELLRRSKEIRKEFGDRDEPPPPKPHVPLFIPEIYRLGWDTETGSLLIHIRKTAIPKLQKMYKEGTPSFLSSNFISNQIESLELTPQEFGIPGISNDLGKGGHIIRKTETEFHITYAWKFEKIPEGKTCFACGGDGKEVFSDDNSPCTECGGAGREVVLDNPTEDGAASFGVLLYILRAIQEIRPIDAQNTKGQEFRRQLVSVYIATPYNKPPDGVLARLDPTLMHYVTHTSEERLEVVNHAMRQALQILSGEEYTKETFRIFRNENQCAFIIPNTEAGLLYDLDARPLETDYEVDHNPACVLSGQGLTKRTEDLILLAGLGALSDEIEQKAKP